MGAAEFLLLNQVLGGKELEGGVDGFPRRQFNASHAEINCSMEEVDFFQTQEMVEFLRQKKAELFTVTEAKHGLMEKFNLSEAVAVRKIDAAWYSI